MLDTFETKYIHPLKDIKTILEDYTLPCKQLLKQQELSLIKQMKGLFDSIFDSFLHLQQSIENKEAEIWETHVSAIDKTFKQFEKNPILDKNYLVTLDELKELINQGKKHQFTTNIESNIVNENIFKLNHIVNASEQFLGQLKQVYQHVESKNFMNYITKLFNNVNLEEEINQIFNGVRPSHVYNPISFTQSTENSVKASDNRSLDNDIENEQSPNIHRVQPYQKYSQSNLKGFQIEKQYSSQKQKRSSNSISEVSSCYSDEENKLQSKEQSQNQLQSYLNSQIKITKNSKLRVDLRKSMIAWGKNKKIFGESIRQITKLVNYLEKEIHSNYGHRMDSYSQYMLILWEILENCKQNHKYSGNLKSMINEDSEFGSKLLDNINDHQNFILKPHKQADQKTQQIIQQNIQNDQYNNYNQQKPVIFDLNILDGIIKMRIKVNLYIMYNSNVYTYQPNQLVGEALITRKYMKTTDFQEVVKSNNVNLYFQENQIQFQNKLQVVGWLERIKKNQNDLEDIFSLMYNEDIIIKLKVSQSIKLYLLTQRQAQELDFLAGYQFYYHYASKNQCFFVIGYTDSEQTMFQNGLFVLQQNFLSSEMVSFGNQNMPNTKRISSKSKDQFGKESLILKRKNFGTEIDHQIKINQYLVDEEYNT